MNKQEIGYHKVTSENKDTAYMATVLFFNSVAQMAYKKVGGWELSSTCTSGEIVVTEYINGKMLIKAITIGNEHCYEFGPQKASEE